MKPFGCPVTILNTLDHLGKFEEKADEGFLVGYSVNSKAFRVFNSRIRKVEENMHIKFLKNKPNVVGRGPEWLFDIDSLTISMNYEPVNTGNQTNHDAGIEIHDNARQAGQEKASDHEYILLRFMPSLSTQSLDDRDADEVPGKGNEGVWNLVDLPNGKRAIGTKWVFKNKKDERGIVIRNKARLVTQCYTQEEGIDYDEVFAYVARIEAI
nr:retrovirus-related Pol polyprotein from transposon TNT 1-94 [Tanacetum cinerariifolium]